MRHTLFRQPRARRRRGVRDRTDMEKSKWKAERMVDAMHAHSDDQKAIHSKADRPWVGG